MAAARNGSGYTMAAADGGLFRFGPNSPFYGSAVNACAGAPAVAVALSRGAAGYWIAFADARTYAFSPTSHTPHCNPTPASNHRLVEPDGLPALPRELPSRHH